MLLAVKEINGKNGVWLCPIFPRAVTPFDTFRKVILLEDLCTYSDFLCVSPDVHKWSNDKLHFS